MDVSLNEGLAKIQLEPGNTVTVDQLRKLVENNGFTPKEAHVAVGGKVTSRADTLHLEVSGLDRSYQLSLAPESKKSKEQLAAQVNRTLLIQGIIPDPKQEKGRVLKVLDFESINERSSK